MRTFLAFLLSFLSCTTTNLQNQDPLGFTGKKGDYEKYPYMVFDREVNENTVSMAIGFLNENVDAAAIIIEWDTPGGSVFDGMALSKTMEQHPAKIVCVVNGMAASMGAYLLQSCDERLMTKDSMLMFHEPSVQTYGKSGDMDEAAESLRAINEALVAHCAKKMSISEEEFAKKIEGRDWWLSYRGAMQYHAIDGVVPGVFEVVISYRESGKAPPETIWWAPLP